MRDVSIDFLDGQVTAIIGPSGCGKSTLLRCLNRMHETVPLARVKGEVLLDDREHLRARREPDRGAPAHRHGVPAADAVPDDVDPRQRRRRTSSVFARSARRDGETDEIVEERSSARRCGTK